MEIKTFIRNLINPPLKLTEDEARVKTVIESMLQHPDTKFRLSPLTGSILLKQKEAGFYLLIEGSNIKICNHAFALHSNYRLNFVEEMKSTVYKKVEADRQEAITEIFNNQQSLLDGMIKTLSI